MRLQTRTNARTIRTMRRVRIRSKSDLSVVADLHSTQRSESTARSKQRCIGRRWWRDYIGHGDSAIEEARSPSDPAIIDPNFQSRESDRRQRHWRPIPREPSIPTTPTSIPDLPISHLPKVYASSCCPGCEFNGHRTTQRACHHRIGTDSERFLVEEGQKMSDPARFALCEMNDTG